MTTIAPSIVPAIEPAATVPEAKKKAYEFDDRFQSKIAALTLKDTIFAQRTEGLIKPEYFTTDAEAAIVAVALDYYKKYQKAIDPGSLNMVIKDAVDRKMIRKDLLGEVVKKVQSLWKVPVADREFAIDKCAEFAKQRAMEQAILSSISALEKGDYDKINKMVQAALTVGSGDENPGYDYFAEIENRTERRKALLTGTIKPAGITTGYPELDKHLYHGGFGRKELSALMARAKWGKSMGLGDFAKNAAVAGYNVLICSCEVSADIYSDRLDANFTETAMTALKSSPIEVKRKLDLIAATSKPIHIHEYASGTLKPSQLRRLIERYRSRGIMFDLIAVDYADIMCPERYTDNLQENSKSVWLDLRAIAFEQNAAVLTATQTNREGAKKMTAAATDVAEDYNKVRIADLLISGNATEAEVAANEARLHFAASRNQKEVILQIKQDREKMRFLTKILGVVKPGT